MKLSCLIHQVSSCVKRSGSLIKKTKVQVCKYKLQERSIWWETSNHVSVKFCSSQKTKPTWFKLMAITWICSVVILFGKLQCFCVEEHLRRSSKKMVKPAAPRVPLFILEEQSLLCLDFSQCLLGFFPLMRVYGAMIEYVLWCTKPKLMIVGYR